MNAERYITPELKEFEDKALSSKSRALSREKALYEQLLETLNGRQSFLMRWAVIKAVAAVTLMLFCMWQFFQQETLMAM